MTCILEASEPLNVVMVILYILYILYKNLVLISQFDYGETSLLFKSAQRFQCQMLLNNVFLPPGQGIVSVHVDVRLYCTSSLWSPLYRATENPLLNPDVLAIFGDKSILSSEPL